MSRSEAEGEILVVEDDEDLRFVLCDNLDTERYRVTEVSSLRAARRELERASFDLVILDLMLPDGDGYQLCRELRAKGRGERVLMLTARTLEDDVVQGFDAGADDYVLKPYRLRELLARVRSLIRRGREGHEKRRLSLPGFELDLDARLVTSADGVEVPLTRTEFDLLAALLRHRGVAQRRDQLIDVVWGSEVVVDPRTVDNFVASLRKKLDWQPEHSWRLATVRGVGYRLEVDEAEG